MKQHARILVLFLMIVFHASTILGMEIKDAALIDKACKLSEDDNLCVAVLKQDPHSANACNMGDLVIIVLEIAQGNGKALVRIAARLEKQTPNPLLKQCFHLCVDQYGDFIASIGGAIVDFKNNPKTIVNGLESALDDVFTCEECFTEKPVLPNPITVQNNLNRRLLYIADRIAANI